MLKKIEGLLPLTHEAKENIVIRRNIISGIKKINNVLEKNKSDSALEKIKTEQECKLLTEEAYKNGYIQGFLNFTDQMLEFCKKCEEIVFNKQEVIIKDLIALIKETAGSPDMLINVVEEWRNLLPSGSKTVILSLPSSLQDNIGDVEERLRQCLKCEYIIQFHGENFFIFRWMEYIAEFTPEEYANNLGETLLEHSIHESENEDIFKQAVEKIKEKCDHLLGFVEGGPEKFPGNGTGIV